MTTFPNCKINLGLNILRKRTDGYHDIATIFIPVFSLRDRLTIELSHSSETTIDVTGITIDGDPRDNLCFRAWQLLNEEFGLPPVDISLEKNIPFGAGLGGGSSDAAFVLKMLNELFALHLDEAQLQERAARLGADCPFFIVNRPVYATGIGDQLEPIELDFAQMGLTVEIAKPHDSVSTPEAYRGVMPHLAEIDLRHAVRLPVEQWRETIVNDFERSILATHPSIERLKEDFYRRGAIYASMSGSGSAVFGLFRA